MGLVCFISRYQLLGVFMSKPHILRECPFGNKVNRPKSVSGICEGAFVLAIHQALCTPIATRAAPSNHGHDCLAVPARAWVSLISLVRLSWGKMADTDDLIFLN